MISKVFKFLLNYCASLRAIEAQRKASLKTASNTQTKCNPLHYDCYPSGTLIFWDVVDFPLPSMQSVFKMTTKVTKATLVLFCGSACFWLFTLKKHLWTDKFSKHVVWLVVSSCPYKISPPYRRGCLCKGPCSGECRVLAIVNAVIRSNSSQSKSPF